MSDGPIEATTCAQQIKDSHLGSLATQVVSDLATRRAPPLNASAESWTRHLAKSARDRDAKRIGACVHDMLEAGIPTDVIVDSLIPEAARMLGADWVRNTLSFAEVTIGSARLQSALRLPALVPAHDVAAEGHAIVLTPEGETHTLGAMTLAAQLRRCRMSVEVFLGPNRSELARLGRSRPDFVAISCTTDRALNTLQPTIDALRLHADRGISVAVGGPALERLKASGLQDVDLVANDLNTLMRLRRAPSIAGASKP